MGAWGDIHPHDATSVTDATSYGPVAGRTDYLVKVLCGNTQSPLRKYRVCCVAMEEYCYCPSSGKFPLKKQVMTSSGDDSPGSGLKYFFTDDAETLSSVPPSLSLAWQLVGRESAHSGGPGLCSAIGESALIHGTRPLGRRETLLRFNTADEAGLHLDLHKTYVLQTQVRGRFCLGE